MALIKMNLLKAINHALDYSLQTDPKVVLFGQDLAKLGGVFRVTAGLQIKHGIERVFDTPISESSIVGSAIGMAINGLKPIAEIQFDGFCYVGLQDLFTHAARMRNRTRGTRTVPMVLRIPVGGGIKALEHHSESLESIFGSIPGLKVVIPSTPYDAKGLLLSAIADPDPVVYFEPKRIYRAVEQQVPDNHYQIQIGKAKVVKEGSDLTIVAWGAMMNEVQKATELLQKENISVELIDLRTINPIDTTTIMNSVQKTGKFVVVHEACKTYGPAGELIALVNEKAFDYLEVAPIRITGHDIIMPLARGEKHQCLSPERIVYYIKKLFATI